VEVSFGPGGGNLGIRAVAVVNGAKEASGGEGTVIVEDLATDGFDDRGQKK
jgi:hypothetical protein